MNPESAGPAGFPSLAELSAEHFRPLLSQTFVLHRPEGGALSLKLSEVTPARWARSGGARAAFSVIFHCPELPAGQYIRQGSYRFEHPQLGTQELFITPVAPDSAGVRYEAVFG